MRRRKIVDDGENADSWWQNHHKNQIHVYSMSWCASRAKSGGVHGHRTARFVVSSSRLETVIKSDAMQMRRWWWCFSASCFINILAFPRVWDLKDSEKSAPFFFLAECWRARFDSAARWRFSTSVTMRWRLPFALALYKQLWLLEIFSFI
jgi:hypothetical protein